MRWVAEGVWHRVRTKEKNNPGGEAQSTGASNLAHYTLILGVKTSDFLVEELDRWVIPGHVNYGLGGS